MALGVVILLLLLDVTGLSQKWKPAEYQILQERAKEGVACQIVGTVRYYERKPKSIYIYLEDTILTVQSEQYSIKESIIKYSGTTDYFSLGNILCIDGELEAIFEASNPGQFDAKKFYRARNIDFFIKSENFTIVDERYDWLKGTIYQFRENFHDKINSLEPQESGILNAMLTGEKMYLEEEDKIRYQMMGVYHIICISGCHFGAIWLGIRWLLGKVRFNYYLSAVLSGIIMMAFGIFVGDNIPATRALAMILIYLGAKVTGRTYDMLSAMALSAILILAQFPGLLYDGGFQLSFGAIIALGMVHPVLVGEETMKRKWTKARKIRHSLRNSFCGGLSIWMVTLPITLYAFYEVSLWGILLNLLVVPTSSIVLAAGLLGGLSGFINMTLAKVLIFPAKALLYIYDTIGVLVQRIPYTTLILGQPKIWQCVAYYLVLIAFLVGWNNYNKKEGNKNADNKDANSKNASNKKRRHNCLFAPVIVTVLLTIFLGFRTYSKLQITALDVGQGDSLVIALPTGNHYLVDGGSTNVSKVGTYRIMPYLKSQGIGTLQAVMITHPDADHLNGIIEMLEAIKNYQTSIRIKQFILPAWMIEDEDARELRTLLAETNIPVAYVTIGDNIKDGATTFEILNPDKETYVDANEGSLTFVLKYREFAGAFTGDLHGRGEALVEENIDTCQFLKVAHHGSKNSTSESFLAVVNPQLSIISCSATNAYGHPHVELLERLFDAQSEVYSTTVGGAITVRTEGKKSIEVSTYK